MFKQNIGDCVGRQDESIGNPLDPPLFWLDNIFKGLIFCFKFQKIGFSVKCLKNVGSILMWTTATAVDRNVEYGNKKYIFGTE